MKKLLIAAIACLGFAGLAFAEPMSPEKCDEMMKKCAKGDMKCQEKVNKTEGCEKTMAPM